MRFLDNPQGIKTAADFGWASLDQGRDALSNRFPYGHSFLVPADSGRKTAISRLIVSGLKELSAEGLLWISPHSPWPSSENPALFAGYRRSLGETRALSEVPYHQYDQNDYIALECLIDLLLYFSWDAVLTDFKNDGAFHFSHDEGSIALRVSKATL